VIPAQSNGALPGKIRFRGNPQYERLVDDDVFGIASVVNTAKMFVFTVIGEHRKFVAILVLCPTVRTWSTCMSEPRSLPKLNRVAILRTASGTADDVFLKETEVPARALGIQLVPVRIQGPDDLEDAFRSMTKERANGLFVRLLTYIPFKRVADLTMKNRLPSVAQQHTWTDAGGLMSYGADPNIIYRRAATYVDKILKGAKPANLPVETPTKFDLAINLKTAKQIGLMIPQRVLLKANRVIK
jgi:ABC-type uncharacterized transport system substrate-binding protein